MIYVDKYRIRKLDEYNWCLDERRIGKSGKAKGKERWRNRAYYSKLEQAAVKLLNRRIGDRDAAGLARMIKAIRSAEKTIVKAVNRLEHSNKKTK